MVQPDFRFWCWRKLSYDVRMVFRAKCLAILLTPLMLSLCDAARTRAAIPQNPNDNAGKLRLREQRSSSLDLEIGGNLLGLPAGVKRFLRRDDLLKLPQLSFTAEGDPNLGGPLNVRGVLLEVLVRALVSDRANAVVVAVCKDWYRSYYPQTYREIHKPVLALEINGQPPAGWPGLHVSPAISMAPYLITQAHFMPSFKILAHEDEAQIPWGVVRLDFDTEEFAFHAIEPRGPKAHDPAVQAGYYIAQQNCFRCHGPESDQPLKGKLTWTGVAMFASQAPKNFAAYVHDPQSVSKDAQMPANPDYDEPTLQALLAYFRTFASAEK
jgi:mono/diheme cytochrome c family protein